MNTDTKVVRLRQPDEIDDPLTDVLRAGARRLLAQAIELEADAFLADMRDLKLPDGRARLVRHGHGPEREIQTGIGPVPVSRVRIRAPNRRLSDVHPVKLENALLRVHPNSANLFHGRFPLSEICNDLSLARSMPSGAVHISRFRGC